jgi:hypothetical protein
MKPDAKAFIADGDDFNFGEGAIAQFLKRLF